MRSLARNVLSDISVSISGPSTWIAMAKRYLILTVACLGLVAARAARDPLTRVPYDGRFTFARLTYTTAPGGYYYRGLPAWAHGYPNAELNLMRILREVSTMRPHLEASNTIAITDPELFRYPVTYMTEPGYWELDEREVLPLRQYLLKGGFLILDDTRDDRGNPAWQRIQANFARILPGLHFIDLDAGDPIYHSFYNINSFDIVHQYYDRGPPVFRALFEGDDPKGRMLVLLNFNTDISNYWEFSQYGFVPIDESNEAYKIGVNYVIGGLLR
jgi:hypothetical protein